MTDLEQIKFNLQEDKFPYFTDVELQHLLDTYADVGVASYNGCLIKAQDDSTKIGPMTTPSNERYWLRRARMFSVVNTGSVKRADGS